MLLESIISKLTVTQLLQRRTGAKSFITSAGDNQYARLFIRRHQGQVRSDSFQLFMTEGIMSVRVIQNQARHMADAAIKDCVSHAVFTGNCRW